MCHDGIGLDVPGLRVSACDRGVAGPGSVGWPGPALDIGVEDDGEVGGDLSVPYTEPHLAANPGDPGHLVAGSIVGFTRARENRSWRCAVMLSPDGGKSWEERLLPLGRCADPWVSLEGDNAWLATLHDLEGAGHGLAVHRSSDGGGSWGGQPVVVGQGHDHPTWFGTSVAVSTWFPPNLARRTSHVSVVALGGLPHRQLLLALPGQRTRIR